MNQSGNVLQVNGLESLWSRSIATYSGIRVSSCYQCLRCTNSCPVSAFMDLKPHNIVRLVHLGQTDRLLECSAIWICLSCEMCSTYCPNEIDVAGLMNHLKNSVMVSRKKPAEYEIAAFHQIFLDVLHNHGRINDLQLMQRYKWKTLIHGHLPPRREVMRDVKLAVELLKRKRLKIMPEKSGGAGEIRRIFKLHGRKGIS